MQILIHKNIMRACTNALNHACSKVLSAIKDPTASGIIRISKRTK
jgi:hypothetical protein